MMNAPTGRHMLNVALCFAALGTSACAQTLPETQYARVVVLDTRPLDSDAFVAPPVVLLVDVTVALSDPARASDADRQAHAEQPCRAASAWLRSLRDGLAVRVQPFERPASTAPPCTIDFAGSRARIELARDVWKMPDAAAALGALLKAPDAHRVRVIAEITSASERAFCELARGAASRGTWIDVVRLDAAPLAGECLGDAAEATSQRASQALRALARPPRSFRVLRHGGDGQVSTLSRSVGGPEPVDIGPGLITVVLEGPTEEWIGPMLLRAGTTTRIRALEMAGEAPAAERSWWDVEESNASAR